MQTRIPLVNLCICALVLILPKTGKSETVTLVRFGSTPGTTTFGLEGWETLLKSGSLNYTARGNGGLVATADPGEYGDFRGVRGTPRRFFRGERIAVTWYNDSDEPVSFTARISFTDADEPDESGADGRWYTMRGFQDYRLTYSEILPRQTAKTVFHIADSGVHRTDSVYTLVNINLAVEWGSTYQKRFLICEQIELRTDADVSPPEKPSGLTASVLSDSEIRLGWNAPADDVGAVEYLVYRDGEVEGYARVTEHTCVFLEPATEYTFTVTALDAAGNESAHSDPVRAATRAFLGREDLIHPAGLDYLGAFLVPEVFAWGGEAIATNPHGDGGRENPADNFPGALFLTHLNQPENGWVGEIDIPAPRIPHGKDPDGLNQAAILRAPVNIRPPNVNAWDFVDVWRTGLEVVSGEARLYSTWSIHYTVTGEKHASISCCNISDLSGSPRYGAWFLGDPGRTPIDAMMGDWLFSLPQEWADAHCSGRTLVTGRCRDGGLSGLGPTLYAFSPVGRTPPPAGQSLDLTTLLEYGPVDGYLPDAMAGYNLADDWRDAAWLSADGRDAVSVIGNKALGDNWYGYHGERMRHDWVIADLPCPDFWETDPDGKGWRSHTRQPMILFYDPQDLAAVAGGSMPSGRPQPYAALRIPKEIFFGIDHEIFSAAWDAENRILYVTEFVRERDGRLILHAWRIHPVSTAADADAKRLPDFRLLQNHPNPFNPSTTIRFKVKKTGFVNLKVFNVTGQEIAELINERKKPGEYRVPFDASGLATGLYLYRIQMDEYRDVKKMILSD